MKGGRGGKDQGPVDAGGLPLAATGERSYVNRLWEELHNCPLSDPHPDTRPGFLSISSLSPGLDWHLRGSASA